MSERSSSPARRNLIYFHEVDKGGHFRAWEQPELFTAEIPEAFKSAALIGARQCPRKETMIAAAFCATSS